MVMDKFLADDALRPAISLCELRAHRAIRAELLVIGRKLPLEFRPEATFVPQPSLARRRRLHVPGRIPDAPDPRSVQYAIWRNRDAKLLAEVLRLCSCGGLQCGRYCFEVGVSVPYGGRGD